MTVDPMNIDSSQQIEVTRTYLEMTAPAQLQSCEAPGIDVRVEQTHECPVSFFRYLYREVGRVYHWVDRLEWSDEEVRARVSDPDVSLWAMWVKGSPAGYFELERHEDGSIEIAYFGLLPEFIGRGFGKYLLSQSVTKAWVAGANRVWLHTCTLDDPAAMPNYLKRGFRSFKEEKYFTSLSPGEVVRGAISFG